MLTKGKIVRQNLIRQLPVGKSRTIASHEQDMRGYRKLIHDADATFRLPRKLTRVARAQKQAARRSWLIFE
jgi:hypothetical protein